MKRLAIVGSHPQTRGLVPWDDKTFDIWTINEAATMKDSWVKRTTAILQLHKRAIWDNPQNKNDPHHGEWLKVNKEATIYMLEEYPDVPMCVRYPYKEIVAKYLSNFNVISHRNRNEFFTCTVAYMAALAVYLGYEEVNFYGVELSVESEYRFQRPGAAFWIGLLTQHAKVNFFGQMFDAPIYGIEAEGEISRELIEKRHATLLPRCKEEQDKVNALHAQFIALHDRFRDTGVDYEPMAGAWQALTRQLNAFGAVDGARQELDRKLFEIDEMIRLDGEYRFSHHGFARAEEAIRIEREKTGLEHSHLAGQIDIIFGQAVEYRLTDSKRKHYLDILDKLSPGFFQYCQKVGIYTGAMMENKLLGNIIAEQRDAA